MKKPLNTAFFYMQYPKFLYSISVLYPFTKVNY
nr:MAG TPA: hypothetical protein [Caudoviricetes sp.]